MNLFRGLLLFLFCASPLYSQVASLTFEDVENADLDEYYDYTNLIDIAKKHQKEIVTKLLQKADNLFSEEAYNDAADIYSFILEDEGMTGFPPEVIEKAAESHYLASSFQKAYKWYDELYKLEGSNISEKSYTNYVNSLGEIGKMVNGNSLESNNITTSTTNNKSAINSTTTPLQKSNALAVSYSDSHPNSPVYSGNPDWEAEIGQSIISGNVTEHASNLGLNAVTVELIDTNTQVIQQSTTDESGVFVFDNVSPEETYAVRFVKTGFYDNETFIRIEKDDVENKVHISLKPHSTNKTKNSAARANLNAAVVYFDYGKYDVNMSASKTLSSIITMFKRNPKLQIRIEAHTDSRGSKAFNKQLSQKRALSIKRYLLSKGLKPRNIKSAVGYGESRLINACSDGKKCPEEMHQKNRRTEFVVTSY